MMDLPESPPNAKSKFSAVPVETRLRIGLFFVLFVVAVAYTIESLGFQRLARYAPFVAGAGTSVLLLLALVIEIRGAVRGIVNQRRSVEYSGTDEALTPRAVRRSFLYVGWIVGLLVAVYLVGLLVAVAAYVSMFLRLDARRSTVFSVIGAAATVGLLVLIGTVLNVEWPHGIVFPGI